MDSLKAWKAKTTADNTFANMNIFMRTKYHALRQVGKLSVADSSLNMLKELTDH